MLTTIFLAVIAIALIAIIVILIKVSIRVQKSINLLETDLHIVSAEMTRFLNVTQEFIASDLHKIAQETSQLVSHLNGLSSNINSKAHSFDFLFKPFHFLNNKLNTESSSAEAEHADSHKSKVLQIIKWIGSSVSLIKQAKEAFKDEKRT